MTGAEVIISAEPGASMDGVVADTVAEVMTDLVVVKSGTTLVVVAARVSLIESRTPLVASSQVSIWLSTVFA